MANNSYGIPLPPCSYVDDIMYDYYGIDTYHVVADPNNEYIDHIDFGEVPFIYKTAS